MSLRETKSALVTEMARIDERDGGNDDKISLNSNQILSQSDASENMFDFAPAN